MSVHIFLKFKILTGQNRSGKDLKVKIPEETQTKKTRFCVFCFAENIRVRRGPCGGGEVEVEKGRFSYVAVCRSLGSFLRGVQAGIEQVFFSSQKTPCFDTITVEVGKCLVRGDPS